MVDQAALEESISKRGIVAGLDVFENEPSSDGEWNTSIAQLPGVYGTHHIGAQRNKPFGGRRSAANHPQLRAIRFGSQLRQYCPIISSDPHAGRPTPR